MRNSDSAERVRRFLRAQRKQHGWSQTDLAQHAGVARNTVAALERGMALREGNEGAIEKALGLELGTIENVRRGRLQPEEEPPEPAPAGDEPDPMDYPDELEYMSAVYWFLRKSMSHEAVLRGFNMAAAIYARRNAASDTSPPQGDDLGRSS